MPGAGMERRDAPALRAGDGAGVGSEERRASEYASDTHQNRSLFSARRVRARSSCAPEVLGDVLEAIGGRFSGSGSRLDRGGIFSALSQPH